MDTVNDPGPDEPSVPRVTPEEPPAHVWSGAVAAAVSADPARAGDLADLLPVGDGPAGADHDEDQGAPLGPDDGPAPDDALGGLGEPPLTEDWAADRWPPDPPDDGWLTEAGP